MPRASVSGGLETKLSAVATRPGFLIEIAFSTVVRFSSRGDVTISGTTWVARPFTVTAPPTPTITFPDTDNAIATFLQTDKVAGRSIRLWKFEGDAPSSTEYVEYFSGEGDDYSITARQSTIRATLPGADWKKLPNTRIVRNAVRQEVIKPGTKFFWGAELYTLDN